MLLTTIIMGITDIVDIVDIRIKKMDKLQPKDSSVSVTTEPMITTMVSVRMPLETAQYLLDVLTKVGGNPTGPRGKITEILRVLENAGVKRHVPSIRGEIYIEDPS